jgi:hypothetical protein
MDNKKKWGDFCEDNPEISEAIEARLVIGRQAITDWLPKRRIIGTVIAATLLMLLFPPWVQVISAARSTAVSPAEYAFLLDPPMATELYIGYMIDWGRLMLQMVILAIGAVGYILIKKGNK